jgi:uncharacterized protein YkwD
VLAEKKVIAIARIPRQWRQNGVESTMNNLQRGWAACLLLAGHLLLAQEPLTRSSRAASPSVIQPEAWRIVELANQARAEAGAGALKWDPALADAARKHCLRMTAEGSISHRYRGEPDPAERAAQAGAHFNLVEENVALGPDPATIHQQWMHSPGHRVNLLNPDVDRIGVAVVAGRHGLYAVADYARNVPVLSQAQVEARVAGMVHDSGVAVDHDAKDAREACATDDGVPGSRPGSRSRFVMRWQSSELNQLPDELTETLASGEFRRAQVASCPAQGQRGSFTAYRLAVLLY